MTVLVMSVMFGSLWKAAPRASAAVDAGSLTMVAVKATHSTRCIAAPSENGESAGAGTVDAGDAWTPGMCVAFLKLKGLAPSLVVDVTSRDSGDIEELQAHLTEWNAVGSPRFVHRAGLFFFSFRRSNV